MHGDGARHGAGRAVLAAGGLVAALARVVLLLHEVVARAEGDEVRVVGGRGDGHGARAAHVRVAQLVREALQLVRPEVVVVPQHVVVRRTRGALPIGNDRNSQAIVYIKNKIKQIKRAFIRTSCTH